MLKKLAGNSIYYVLGMLLNRGLSFLLLPIYTRHLTPADYGVLAMCGSVTAILSATITLGVGTATSIFYFKLEREEYLKLLRTIWLWMVITPLLVVGILQLVGPRLTASFFTTVPWNPYLRLAVWIAYFNLISDVVINLLMSEQKPVRYVMFTVASFLITTGFLIYFVAVHEEGALGSLHGQLIAGIIMTVLSHWLILRRCWTWSLAWFDKKYLREAIILCAPLIPHSLSLWALNISDRWILGHFVPLSDIGIYNLAYLLGMIVHFFGMGFNMAFTPLYFERANDKDFRAQLPKLLGHYLLIITWVMLAISVLAPEILRVMTQPAYYAAASVVPWIAAGNWFVVGIYHQCVVVLEGHKRTAYIILLTGPAAVLNISLNWILVPRYGILAAAFNTLLAFLLMAVLSLVISRRIDKLPFPWSRIAQMIAVAVAAYWGAIRWLQLFNLSIALLSKTIMLIISALIMARIAGFNLRDLRALRTARSETNPAA